MGDIVIQKSNACSLSGNDSFVCKTLRAMSNTPRPSFSKSPAKMCVKRPPKPKITRGQRLWKFFIQFAKLVKAADIQINRMAMNGRRKGCHCREAAPIPKGKTAAHVKRCYYRPRLPRPKGCDTLYKAGTEANARLEIRPVAGKPGISRVYRFWVDYTKPLTHLFKGWFPVTTYGFYGDIGHNWNDKGPLCKSVHLGVFGNRTKLCNAFDRHFGIPLTGSIPQNWIRRIKRGANRYYKPFGNFAYVLDYPTNFKRYFTDGFLGVWGMVDRAVYKRMGVPYMTFPSRFDQVVELLSTINISRATHVNRNKLNNSYKPTGQKPHIEWLDLHDARITMLLRDGSIDVPGLGKITLDSKRYLRSANLDRHPRLLTIARQWRVYRKGSPKHDPVKAKRLAIAYYRERSKIKKNVNRIEIRSTAKSITIAVHNPTITALTLPLGAMNMVAKGLSIGSIKVVLPSLAEMIARRKFSVRTVSVEGLTARKLSFIDRATKSQLGKAEDARIGSIALDRNGKLTVSHLDALSFGIGRKGNGLSISSGYTYVDRISASLKGRNRGVRVTGLYNKSLRIASPLVHLDVTKSTMKNIRATANAKRMAFSIGSISTDIRAGMIGGIKFGRVSVGSGGKARGTVRKGSLSIVKDARGIKAVVQGLVDILVNGATGSKIGLNVPGLKLGGTLNRIHIKGPTRFILTPTSWELSRPKLSGSPASAKLRVSASISRGAMTHRLPTQRTSGTGGTKIDIASATIGLDVGRIAFLSARHPGATGSSFTHLDISNASISNIMGSGRLMLPTGSLLGARFRKMRGSVGISSIKVRSNGRKSSSTFRDVALNLRETYGQGFRCSMMLPLLMFAPNKYFIGDPNGKPLNLNCRIKGSIPGIDIQIKSKRRPLKHLLPRKP